MKHQTADTSSIRVEEIRKRHAGKVVGPNSTDDIEWLLGEREALRDALTYIGCFDDTEAERRFLDTGSYSSFDEPWSVETARKALEQT